MTRIERKAMLSKRTQKTIKKVIFAVALVTGGLVSSVITKDATALVVILFFVAPLFLTTRRIYTK